MEILKNKVALLLATWFGSGLIPPPKFMNGMAGTYGSFFSLPLCFAVVWLAKQQADSSIAQDFLQASYFMILWFIYLIGIWAVPRGEIILGPKIDYKGKTRSHDQNQIVIDETWGMLITCIPLVFLPITSYWMPLLLAFGLFRFFDIVKVPPTKHFDRKINAMGVMMDDGVAGFYAAICLTIIMLKLYMILLAVVALICLAWLEEYSKKKYY